MNILTRFHRTESESLMASAWQTCKNHQTTRKTRCEKIHVHNSNFIFPKPMTVRSIESNGILYAYYTKHTYKSHSQTDDDNDDNREPLRLFSWKMIRANGINIHENMPGLLSRERPRARAHTHNISERARIYCKYLFIAVAS